jgi:hypothetical protein
LVNRYFRTTGNNDISLVPTNVVEGVKPETPEPITAKLLVFYLIITNAFNSTAIFFFAGFSLTLERQNCLKSIEISNNSMCIFD